MDTETRFLKKRKTETLKSAKNKQAEENKWLQG